MRFENFIIRRSARVYLVLLMIIIVTVITYRALITSNSEPLLPFIKSFLDSWLWLAVRPAMLILEWIGSEIIIDSHQIILNNDHTVTLRYDVLLKNWLLLCLIIIWITPSSLRQKMLFTGILLVVNYISVSLVVTILTYLVKYGYDYHSASRAARTPGILSLLVVLHVWLRIHVALIVAGLSKLKLFAGNIGSKIFEVFRVLIVYVIVRYLIAGVFDFRIWIGFLLFVSKKILAVLGYEAFLEPFYLIGNAGSVFVDKACLGISTMILFCFVIYLSGGGKGKRLLYIGSGLILLNVINIVRFVVLFIYLEKYGDSPDIIVLHEVYNYFIYAVIFILWVVWFEKFSDIKAKKLLQNEPGWFHRSKLKSKIP